MDPEIFRRRSIREIILGLTSAAMAGGAKFGITFEQIQPSFSPQRFPVTIFELREEIADLVGNNLLQEAYDEQLRETFYKITPSGRDFKAAKFPWGQVDKFTGRQ